MVPLRLDQSRTVLAIGKFFSLGDRWVLASIVETVETGAAYVKKRHPLDTLGKSATTQSFAARTLWNLCTRPSSTSASHG